MLHPDTSESHAPRLFATRGHSIKSTDNLSELNGLAERGRVNDAEAVLRKLIARGNGSPQQTRMAYNMAIKACSLVGDVDKANLLFEEMRARSVKPNVQTFGKLMATAANAKRSDLVEQWQSMLKQFNLSDNRVTYSSQVHVAARSGDVAQAKRILAEMSGAKMNPSVVEYSATISAAAKCNRRPEAESLFFDMVRSAVVPNRISFNSVMDACAMEGDLLRTVLWLRRLEFAGVSPDPVSDTTLISACARAEDDALAVELYKAMVAANSGVDKDHFDVFVPLLKVAGTTKNHKLVDWLWHDEIPKRMRGSMGSLSHPLLHGVFLQAIVQTRGPSVASDWLSRFSKDGIRLQPAHFGCVINGFAQGGFWEQAHACFNQMSARSIEPQLVQYNALLKAFACSKPQRCKEARQLFEELVVKGVPLNPITLQLLRKMAGTQGVIQMCERSGVDPMLLQKRDFDASAQKRFEFLGLEAVSARGTNGTHRAERKSLRRRL